MGMFIAANVLGSTVQISMLPLPVLSTLQASGLVFNSICASLILGEPFTRWSLWGTLLVCCGAVLIAIFGAIPSPAHKLNELLDLLGRRPFVLWMSFQAVLVVGIAMSTDLASHFSSMAPSPRFRLARGLAYGCISGILSAHSLLVAKSAVELIVRTIADGDNQFVHWQSWMLVVGLVVLALSQLYYLHRGLKLVSTSVLYPLVFCIYNIIAILDGLIYFRQTDLITPLHACLIALGTAILLSGVLALSWRLSDEQHPPAVGQSTLAPGLGLVEDTEGEEEEEELLLASDIGGDEDAVLPTRYSYNTFSQNGEAHDEPSLTSPAKRKSMAPSLKTTTSRWTERAEIWGELEDEAAAESPHPAGLGGRRRSSTMPQRSDSASLLHIRRGVSGPIAGAMAANDPDNPEQPDSPTVHRRGFRRRRKSTGFPGFTARKSARRKSSIGGLQDAVFSGILRLRWWQQRGSKDKNSADPPPSRGSGATWPPYTDDPEAALGEGSAIADTGTHQDEDDDLSPGARPNGFRGTDEPRGGEQTRDPDEPRENDERPGADDGSLV
jgi:hypothetical protein